MGGPNSAYNSNLVSPRPEMQQQPYPGQGGQYGDINQAHPQVTLDDIRNENGLLDGMPPGYG